MKKILVVDNNPVVLRLLESQFARRGHEVRTATNGLAALDLLKEYRPDILFVDLVMPNIGGEKLCRIVRGMESLKGVYIVILSAIAAEERLDVRQFGADACIAKGAFDRIATHLDHVLAEVDKPPAERGDWIVGLEEVHARTITRELLVSKHHYEVILNNMAEGIIEFTPAQQIIYLNPAAAAIIGRPEEEVLASDFLSLFEPAAAACLAEALARVGNGPVSLPEHDALFLRGRQIAVVLYPVGDNDDSSIIALFRDITEQQRAEETLRRSTEQLQQALEELQRAQAVMVRQEKLASIGTLASGVAHEILNPLNIIGTVIQLLQMEDLPPAVHSQLGTVMAQIRRATKITDNLRMFSHHKEAAVGPVDLNRFLDQTLVLVEHDLNLDNILVDRDYDPELPTVQADDDQLAQVFLNLISNARDAMAGRAERRIAIRTRRVGDGVTVTFADTGGGIAAEHLGKIFDPFFTTKDPGHGTGLGLSIVYSIIESHGGTIEVHSEPGKGTEFFIHLPLARYVPGERACH
ncbi:MAG: ATP-binding protein [Thermodesulfobacteriota bacterium]